MTLRTVWRDIRAKHFRIAESSGSIGIVGIVAFIVGAVLLVWKPFLGKFSKWVALLIFLLIPVLNL